MVHNNITIPCPECGSDVDRPKCLHELGASCPRHQYRKAADELRRLQHVERRVENVITYEQMVWTRYYPDAEAAIATKVMEDIKSYFHDANFHERIDLIGPILMRFIDRLNDPVAEDSLHKIATEIRDAVNEELVKEL